MAKQNIPNPLSIAIMVSLSMLCIVASPAFAAPNQECLDAIGDPLLDVWPCFSGTCRACTPESLSDPDTTVPGDEAETVGCTLIVAGSVIFSTSDRGVSELMTINHTLEGDLDCQFRCEDNLGAESEAALQACRFSLSPRPQPVPRGLAPAIMLP